MIVFHWLLSHLLQQGVSSRGTIENNYGVQNIHVAVSDNRASSYLSIFNLLLYLFHTIYKVVI
jgi:hypothetical protein